MVLGMGTILLGTALVTGVLKIPRLEKERVR